MNYNFINIESLDGMSGGAWRFHAKCWFIKTLNTWKNILHQNIKLKMNVVIQKYKN